MAYAVVKNGVEDRADETHNDAGDLLCVTLTVVETFDTEPEAAEAAMNYGEDAHSVVEVFD